MLSLLLAACADDDGPDGVDSDGGDLDSSPTAGCSAETIPVSGSRTLMSGGIERSYHVTVPPSLAPGVPAPLVLNFHGLTYTEAEQRALTFMPDKASALGVISVHPQGVGTRYTSWNAGVCCSEAGGNMEDDVAFVVAMLDSVQAELCVDPQRVYSTGMSNGGFMSHRLACELEDRIAAIAPVAGVNGMDTCDVSRPVPVLHFHGTEDSLVAFDGDSELGFRSAFVSTAEWAARNGCGSESTISFENGDSTCTTRVGCPDGVDVTLCVVQGGGHTWPGGSELPGLGVTTRDLDATERMLEFFLAHPMP